MTRRLEAGPLLVTLGALLLLVSLFLDWFAGEIDGVAGASRCGTSCCSCSARGDGRAGLGLWPGTSR